VTELLFPLKVPIDSIFIFYGVVDIMVVDFLSSLLLKELMMVGFYVKVLAGEVFLQKLERDLQQMTA
jgi:hypothetical protein